MAVFAPLASIVTFALAFAAQDAKPGAKPAAKQEPKQKEKPQEKSDAGADALSYAAFKLETEKRDLPAALQAWTKALDAAATANDPALAKKAQLGRARCLVAMRKREDAKAALDALLAADPKDAEAKALLVELDKGGHTADELAAEAGEMLDVYMSAIVQGNVDSSIQQVRQDVIRMGDAAVPELARRLRDLHSRVVSEAVTILLLIDTERSIATLAEGIRDPAVAYPALLAVSGPNRSRREMLPIARAAFDRSERKLHALGAEWLIELRGTLPPHDAAETTRRMLEDPDPAIRIGATGPCNECATVVELVPAVDQLVEADDEALQAVATYFIGNNGVCVPADAERWTAALGRSRFPSIRSRAWANQLHALRDSDYRVMERCMLALLGDDDPSVFTVGADLLASEGTNSFRETGRDRHEAIVAIGRRAIEAPGLSAKDREVVLSNLPCDALDDDELFDLFTRLAGGPAEMSDVRRAAVRENYARRMMWRHVSTPEARDAFAAAIFRRIQDAAGMKVWLQVAPTVGNDASSPRFLPELGAAAAASADREVRLLVYAFAARNTLNAGRMPHLGEDLAEAETATQLTVLRAIGWGREPSALPALRKVLENSSGELHKAALEALTHVGGNDAAPDFLAEFRRSPRNFDVSLFRTIEAGLGSEALARAIVDVVAADPGLVSWPLADWVNSDASNRRLSAATVEAVCRILPKERLTREVVSSAALLLPPEVVRPIVMDLLKSPNRDDVIGALRLVGRLRIDVAWTQVAALLDASDGEITQQAIDALTKLREYRDLKRTVLADDGDARRAAFEKARALAKSGTAEQRAGSALALAATADVAAIPLLLDLLGDADASVRSAAKLALEKLAERAPATAPAEAPKKDEDKKKSGQ
jgi:HEAT repeat protein